MMTAPRIPGFVETLPKLRGRIQADAPLAPFTWFRAGGAAEVLMRPADADDLAGFLSRLPNEVPVHVIGACSNLIVRDGGLPGVTIRLARGFSTISPETDGIVAGAAALDVTVAEHAAAAELTGLEFLSGIPGSIGGAVAMNAGAYGGDLANVLDWAEIVTRTGERRRLAAAELAFAIDVGVAEINVSESSVFSSIHPQLPVAAAFNPESRVIRRETIRIARLDEVFAEFPKGRAFLKIDTQGYEQQVLMGASGCISEFLGVQMELPIIHLYEGTWRFQEAVAYMDERGFEISNIAPVKHQRNTRRSHVEHRCSQSRAAHAQPRQKNKRAQQSAGNAAGSIRGVDPASGPGYGHNPARLPSHRDR